MGMMMNDSALISADELEMRRQCARWLLAIADCDMPMDDDYFSFVAWINGGLEKLAKIVKERLVLPKGKTREAARARSAVEELTEVHPMRLDDHLSDLYRENPCLQKQIRDLMREMLESQAAESFSLAEMPCLARLEKLFGLNIHELELCYLAFALSQYRNIERFLEDGLELHSFPRRHLLGRMLGMNGPEVFAMLKVLEGMGIMQLHHGCLRLTDNVESALLAPDDKQVRDLFCKPAPRSKVPLDKFYLDEDVVDHAFKLMGRPGKEPTHLLLYGAPGCGKTTFAASLIKKLRVHAWMVPCGERDTTQDRRASLTACLRVASSHPRSIVVVDEAERILDTQSGDLRECSPKAWMNDLLEQEKTRIIWISNYISHLDEAVRRRFSYSIAFETPGRKARKDMWDYVARTLKVEQRMPRELRDKLATEYEVPIATMELAMRQAISLGGSSDLGPWLQRILKAQVTLRNDGIPPRPVNARNASFDPAAVSMDMPMETFMAQAKKMAHKLENGRFPGMGAMLFYGPPGTGKTALARHLANELDRELIVRRASDILGPYVGMTEAKIAAAFHEAESNDAVLLIDEADTFLYSRAAANHSWEQSMTNEFLTGLETFTGMCICTTNFRDNLDNAAMRRFPFKVKFNYAGPAQLETLYRKMLQPLGAGEPGANIWSMLRRQKCLTPGDFAAVRLRLWMEDDLDHAAILEELLKEQKLKLDSESKTVGF